MKGAPWLGLLLMTAGCWQPRYFEPRENLSGSSPAGRPAAVYPVGQSGDDTRSGQLRVWSDGARARYTDAGEEVVDLHVGVELENNGAAPLELELGSLRLEQLRLSGQPSAALPPAAVEGSPRAEAGETARVDVVFRPPARYPRDVDSFGVRLSVRGGGDVLLRQLTPFAPAPPPGFYGPGYGAWGAGYGGAAVWGGPPWGGAYGWGRPWGYGPGPWGWGGGWGPGWGPGWGGPGCR